MFADVGPPIVVIAIGLILWQAVTATVAGVSIQTIGLIVFLAGIVWLVLELVQARRYGSRVVVDETVERRPVYRRWRL